MSEPEPEAEPSRSAAPAEDCHPSFLEAAKLSGPLKFAHFVGMLVAMVGASSQTASRDTVLCLVGWSWWP